MVPAMQKKQLAVLWVFMLCPVLTLSARAGQSLIFASVADGSRILAVRDSFVERMSPFDRSARMKTDLDVSESEFLAFIGKAVLQWDSAETTAVQSALNQIDPALSQLFPALPEPIYVVKTTGEEEANTAYTRGNAIVLPRRILTLPERHLRRVLAHELFHILSRNYPRLRSMLYEAIGFHQCGEVEFPVELSPQKITNPDAPKNDHCIRVRVAGEPIWAIPILFSPTPKYDVARGGELFTYLSFALLVVEKSGPYGLARPIFDAHHPKLLSVNEVSDFFEQVGRNTQYIIHPEEILADNIALLVLGERNLPSPEVLNRIADALAHARAGERRAQDAPKPDHP
jgi:hypothetical protein